MISSFDYVNNEEVLGSIPERDWKLLAALARKREEKDERERLAEQFQKMWLKEKEERQMVRILEFMLMILYYFYYALLVL